MLVFVQLMQIPYEIGIFWNTSLEVRKQSTETQWTRYSSTFDSSEKTCYLPLIYQIISYLDKHQEDYSLDMLWKNLDMALRTHLYQSSRHWHSTVVEEHG